MSVNAQEAIHRKVNTKTPAGRVCLTSDGAASVVPRDPGEGY